MAVALAGAAGPSVGALILSVAGWPWLFAVNLPIGALALVAARALPAVPGTGRAVDALSAIASAGDVRDVLRRRRAAVRARRSAASR